MDIDRLGTGERIAAASAVLLLIIALFVEWFSFGPFGAEGFEAAGTFRDLIMLLTILGGVAIAVMVGMSRSVNSPVAPTAIVAGIAILNTILILIWVIDPPGSGGFSADRSIGLWLGLLASAGVAYGAWRAMEEEGTSFGEQAAGVQERVRGGGEPPRPPRD